MCIDCPGEKGQPGGAGMNVMKDGDVEKAIEFVKKKYQGCPNCGALGVHIHNIVGLPIVTRQSPSGFSLEKQFIAVIPLICDNCGYITLFAAKNVISLE
jgi:predicted nucleic-acid-binding Zn-ribbon protein